MDANDVSQKIKILVNYPGAVLTFIVTLLFWSFLGIFILPVQDKFLTQWLEKEQIRVGGAADNLVNTLQLLYSVSSFITKYIWAILLIYIAYVIYFERFYKDTKNNILRKGKITLYALNTVFILFTATSYAISSLFIIFIPVIP